jgi:hypothetical protein
MPGTVDAYGDQVAGHEALLELEGAFVAPRESSDLTDRGRVGVVVGLTLFAPRCTDLRASDQVDVDGVTYDIDGDPGRWRHPMTGWSAGMTAALTRAQG